MIIESVRLENIRSYSDGTIKFPAGSILLAGDIGCGKSSILLAVDFALFGLRAGELSGTELLRHGTNHGKITLNIRLGGCDVEISRSLERKKDGVAQSAGHLIVDGIKHDLMGLGLRSYVFDLLGYPANLLRRNKSLLYRYTVYTPQEEMKSILLASEDERLSIIRHVFGIDRYRRLRNNATIVARGLGKKMERLMGLSDGLADAEKEKEGLAEEGARIMGEKAALSKNIDAIVSDISDKKKALGDLEKDKEAYAGLCSKIEVASSKKAMLERHASLAEKDILRAKASQKEVAGGSADAKAKIAALEKDIALKPKVKSEVDALEKELRGIDASLSENSARAAMSKDILKRVGEISECPTCLQKVGDAHKKGIFEKENARISNFEKISARLGEEKKAVEKKIYDAKKMIDELGEKEHSLAGLRACERELSRMSAEISTKEEALRRAKKEIESLGSEMDALRAAAEKISGAGEKYNALRKETDVAEGELSLKKQHLARLDQQADDMANNVAALEKEIAEKKAALDELHKIRALQSWILDHFSPLMETIERHMMGKIHHEFNSIFREWFGMLIEDDALSARIDPTFTPLVEQNGFETEFGHLSGGEKTSVALAYRLTLNRVINSLSDMIKTKDILILDEPTDGFSTEQLDKVRDVLRGLALRQIIIVSHEEKMEGFVDNVIRIEKLNGESRVVGGG